jgi:tetratricopeptide (TPR) repeat protein
MERAARLNPYQPEYQHDLAMAAINQGEPDARAYAGAMGHLEAAARLKPIDSRFPLMMARLEARLGSTLFADLQAGERAATLYQEAVRLAPLDPRPRLEQAGHLAELGRPEEALESLRTALELEPHFRRARLLQVSLLVRQGRPREANAAWEALRVTDAILADYGADSSYAADLTRDAPRERERLLVLLSDRPDPGPGEGTR